jgi:DNA (cytosine-5)-methyltransferase 1
VHSDHQRGNQVPAKPKSQGVSDRFAGFGGDVGPVLGHSQSQRLDTRAFPLFAPGPSELELWGETLDRRPGLKPGLYRPVDGLACGLDRSAAAGNGVVPLAAARAFIALRKELAERGVEAAHT